MMLSTLNSSCNLMIDEGVKKRKQWKIELETEWPQWPCRHRGADSQRTSEPVDRSPSQNRNHRSSDSNVQCSAQIQRNFYSSKYN